MDKVIKRFRCTIIPSYFGDGHVELKVEVMTQSNSYTFMENLPIDSFASDFKKFLKIAESEIVKSLKEK